MNHINTRHAVSLTELMKKCSKSRRGFYDFLYDNVTKDEATAVKFCLKNTLIGPTVTCKFCKVIP